MPGISEPAKRAEERDGERGGETKRLLHEGATEGEEAYRGLGRGKRGLQVLRENKRGAREEEGEGRG